MNFVKNFNFYGVDAKEVPCITDKGAPTETTEGDVGCFYMDIDTGVVYKCTAKGKWELLAKESENNEVDNNPDKHAEYFTITDDGIVALKPEYRGACPSKRSAYPFAISDNGLEVEGSKNNELPKDLVIPEVVNEIAVSSLAPAMFNSNKAIEHITLPKFITVIPDRWCEYATNIREIYNTEKITSIGNTAFQSTKIEKAKFPSLETVSGAGQFNLCHYLIYADIGNITSISQQMFNQCNMLSRVSGGANVTSVGVKAFQYTYRLNSVEFLPNLKTEKCIGNYAFFVSRLVYDWNSLPNNVFGTLSTAKQLNPTDIWSACTIKNANENPLPTFLSQNDPRWASKEIGNSGIVYSSGCSLMCMMHIYCGLHNLTFNTVEEWEKYIKENEGEDIFLNFDNEYNDIADLVGKIGLTCERYEGYTQETLQKLYDALSDKENKKYAIVSTPANESSLMSHGVVAYGVKENKELLIANSQVFLSFDINDDSEDKLKYPMVYQNFIVPDDKITDQVNYLVNIISLPTE